MSNHNITHEKSFSKAHRDEVRMEMSEFIQMMNDNYEKDAIHLKDGRARQTNFYAKKVDK